MNHRKIFGQNVRRVRIAQGFSQEELAEKAGIHRTYIGSVERGERNISIDNIVIIANALNIQLADLFGGIITTHAD